MNATRIISTLQSVAIAVARSRVSCLFRSLYYCRLSCLIHNNSSTPLYLSRRHTTRFTCCRPSFHQNCQQCVWWCGQLLQLNPNCKKSKAKINRADYSSRSNRPTNKNRKMSAQVSSVHVNSFEEDDRLSVSIDLLREGRVKSFNLNRLKSEPLGSALQRLQMNLSKKLVKKPKKKKQKKSVETSQGDGSGATPKDESSPPNDECVQDIPVYIIQNDRIVDLTITNESAWVEGAILRIESEDIPVFYNPPSVKLENLSSVILEGFPVYGDPHFNFVDENSCVLYWKTFDSKDLVKIKQQIAAGNIDLAETVQSSSYTPSKSDIGKYLLLACLPKKGDRNGRIDAVISKSVIAAGPGPCPFETRHQYTQLCTEHGVFRMLTYNLLAEMYADSDAARTELFVHCPPHALTMDYRRHLLIKEILGYQADLLCMQEVDKSIFSHLLQPVLRLHGYTGLFRPKAGHVAEGCATFVRDSKFKVVEELDITLAEYLSSSPDVSDIWQAVSRCEELKQRMEERSNILQVTVVASVESPGRHICLGNTHLYFHPTADNIRLLHGATALRYLQSVCGRLAGEGKEAALVFCGDFNSDPAVGVYKLFTSKSVSADCVDWDSAGPEQKISLELSQPMNIQSACGKPAYTNFTPLFQETLDYVYVQSDVLQVESVVPLPDHEEVVAHAGLPSPVFPSDHLALICDLKFK